jgi:hypothetical protein
VPSKRSRQKKESTPKKQAIIFFYKDDDGDAFLCCSKQYPRYRSLFDEDVIRKLVLDFCKKDARGRWEEAYVKNHLFAQGESLAKDKTRVVYMIDCFIDEDTDEKFKGKPLQESYDVKDIKINSILLASYYGNHNGIYINLGYLQKPFVDLDDRGIEYNLAHLGFTIGHEMSHGFDDWGSQYDADGNLNDWWTEEDKKKFKAIQKDVIKQYEEFAARDGIKFDASIGIGEDLADISGMAICDRYLKDFQDNNNDLTPIRYVSYETFYIYYAFQQKQKVSKRALSAQLKTNPHPLDKYRCNVPLSRSPIFRSIYNVKKGNGMWWNNTNMVWIM